MERSQSTWVRNRGQGSALTWLLQRLSGIFIIAIILIHFGINHLIESGEVSYQAVQDRLANPLWKCFDIAFLTFALYHGFVGVWVVACDYIGNAGWRLFVLSSLLLSGSCLFLLGALTIIGFPFK